MTTADIVRGLERLTAYTNPADVKAAVYAAISRLRELELDAADARRYRWLREHNIDNEYCVTDGPRKEGVWMWGDKLDRAIDSHLPIPARDEEEKSHG